MNEYENRALGLMRDVFARKDARLFFAPGRVNLIGEHIDYNGGRVMPCSLSIGTYAAAAPRSDGRINLVSADMPGMRIEASIPELFELAHEPAAFCGFSWGAYPLGVCAKLREAGYDLGGFDMAVSGSLPRGSGLSSSASLEVLTCAVLKELFSLPLTGPEAARLSVSAERDCAGVNCGIMDQFICAVGRKDHALLLDTGTLEHRLIPFDMRGNVLLIMNTRKPRRLADSKYNERRAECEQALELLNAVLPERAEHLCDLTPEQFDEYASALPPVLYKRARHAVYENARVEIAAQALESGDIARLGELLNASHDSLRSDYEVTGRELDSIVDAARMQEGVLGARMTGAGFGGCAIALAESGRAEEISAEVSRIYKDETGYDCEILCAQTADAPFGGNE